jgi:hypothetical protein
LDVVRARLRGAARRAGRDPGEITLVAVTKGVDVERIRAAYVSGIRVLGESRVQEVLPKQEALPADIAWHFIGHLQRNKVKQAVGRFDLIHSVDTVVLAEEISRRAEEMGIRQRILLEVNAAGEASKHGVPPSEVPAMAKEIRRLAGVSLEGLMTIPPFQEDPQASRPYFRMVSRLAREAVGISALISMGMSHDVEVAVEEGATLVRIGTAIFGERR